MADVFSKTERSAIMSRVRSRGNEATELRLVKLLRVHRISGWRRHPRVYGHPDFVFPAQRLAVFVDGCFWHSCPKHGSMPKSNRKFWRAKLLANRRRDRYQRRELRRRGWTVLRIWQHEFAAGNERRLAARLRQALGIGRDD